MSCPLSRPPKKAAPPKNPLPPGWREEKTDEGEVYCKCANGATPYSRFCVKR